MKNRLNNQGFSRVEVICIAGISLVVMALLVVGGWYMLGLMRQGDDANLLNTARRAASLNVQGACLVNDCPGADSPEHAKHVDSSGTVVAYYDKGPNKLVADAPAGYNEGDALEVDGKTVAAEPGTMVVRATLKHGQVVCSWVEAASPS